MRYREDYSAMWEELKKPMPFVTMVKMSWFKSSFKQGIIRITPHEIEICRHSGVRRRVSADDSTGETLALTQRDTKYYYPDVPKDYDWYFDFLHFLADEVGIAEWQDWLRMEYSKCVNRGMFGDILWGLYLDSPVAGRVFLCGDKGMALPPSYAKMKACMNKIMCDIGLPAL